MRTWAPRGQTPVLRSTTSTGSRSRPPPALPGWNFYFRLYPDTIHGAEVVDFLGHLLRHLPGKLPVLWDRLSQHKARAARDFIAAQHGRPVTEYLPAYAPELNPVEYI
jgi:DDE superfamily endonuclease